MLANINNRSMDWFNHFLKFQRVYEIAVASLILVANASVQATTQIMDDLRANAEPSFYLWEPFVWEFSSLVLWLLLVPAIIYIVNSRFIGWDRIGRTLLVFGASSFVISVLHVAGMVLIRKAAYLSQEMNYQFGNVVYEFFYEYRKDLMTFVVIIAAIQSYRFISSRIRGEANLISNGEGDVQATKIDRILVKKLGKEFIVKIADVEWLEACGNYVNLHAKGRIYPTRNTLGDLLDEISDKGFCRTHRSFAVNLDAVESIETLSSGSSEITLKNGEVINLSRRYHDELKQRLH
ncbi:MAG: hypothetical protein ACI9FR_002449 [Cryomorphaceae bacterium]